MINITISIEEQEHGISMGIGVEGEKIRTSEQVITARFMAIVNNEIRAINEESNALGAIVEDK